MKTRSKRAFQILVGRHQSELLTVSIVPQCYVLDAWNTNVNETLIFCIHDKRNTNTGWLQSKNYLGSGKKTLGTHPQRPGSAWRSRPRWGRRNRWPVCGSRADLWGWSDPEADRPASGWCTSGPRPTRGPRCARWCSCRRRPASFPGWIFKEKTKWLNSWQLAAWEDV